LGKQLFIGLVGLLELLKDRRYPCGCTSGGSRELLTVSREEPTNRHSAVRRVPRSIPFGAAVVRELRGPPSIGHHHGKPRAHRLGHRKAERLVRTAMDKRVGVSERRCKLRSVSLEAHEPDVVAARDARLHPLSFGPVTKENKHRIAVRSQPHERVEHDVPSFLHGKPTHADQEGRGRLTLAKKGPPHFIGRAPLRSPIRPRPERVALDTEGKVFHPGHSSQDELIRHPSTRDEGGVASFGDRAHHRPKRLNENLSRARLGPASYGDARVGVDEIGVPRERSHAKAVTRNAQCRPGCDVGRIDLEDIRSLAGHERTNLGDAKKQVIGRIVGKGGACNSYNARYPDAVPTRRRCEDLFAIPRTGGNHDVFMSKLARNVTLSGEMASNSAAPFRIKLGDVEDLQGKAPSTKFHASSNGNSLASSSHPAWQHLRAANTGLAPGPTPSDIPPFAALAARLGRPLRVAILSDFVRIPYANGAAFQTRFLYQELRRCGHEVTVIGPHDPDATPDELAPGTIQLPSVPLKTYPGVHLPMPLASWVYDPDQWNFDICFAQTTSMLMEFGIWLRKMKGIPLLMVNTTHLVAAYDVLLPEKLSKNEFLQAGLHMTLKRPFERLFASIYNEADGLVVLSEGLRSYWRERGVTAPIHVIPRAIQLDNFDKPLGQDPYHHLLRGPHRASALPAPSPDRGTRLLCAGRHTREKSQDRLIRIFAKHVASKDPDVTLTFIGEGPDTAMYKRVARDLGVADRVFFTGEVPWTKMADFYAYADLFVHASLSETYGNVLGEALWCGTPTVAFADGMGVSSQIQDGVNGVLFAPGKGEALEAEADAAFGRAVLELMRDPQARARLGKAAARVAREHASPMVVQQKIADAFLHAQDHAAACGLRPAVDRPKMMQWYTTFQHFRPWTTVMGGIYLFGHLRPAKGKTKRDRGMHPQIGK
jgi:1,2-diacylglycerol 3-alpha-glucosyltransferase